MAVAGDESEVNDLISKIHNKYEVTVESTLDWYLNIAVTRDRKRRLIYLSQERYLLNMLTRFKMEESKPVATPASLEALDPDAPLANDKPYREIVGSELYPAIVTRPDILNSVIRVSRFNASPTLQAWTATKRILRYVELRTTSCHLDAYQKWQTKSTWMI